MIFPRIVGMGYSAPTAFPNVWAVPFKASRKTKLRALNEALNTSLTLYSRPKDDEDDLGTRVALTTESEDAQARARFEIIRPAIELSPSAGRGELSALVSRLAQEHGK